MRPLIRNWYARAAIYIDLVVLSFFGLTQVLRGTLLLFVIGVVLLIAAPVAAAYVHRAAGRACAEPTRMRARRSILVLSYSALAFSFLIALALLSGYWVQSGPLGIIAFVVVLLAPLGAAYLSDSAATSR